MRSAVVNQGRVQGVWIVVVLVPLGIVLPVLIEAIRGTWEFGLAPLFRHVCSFILTIVVGVGDLLA